MALYRVTGSRQRGYAVVLRNSGVIEYDLLSSRSEAERICSVLNQGIGPEWDAVLAALQAAPPEDPFRGNA